MRVLELFAGIGGCTAALPGGSEVIAVDQSPVALAAFRHAWPEHRTRELHLVAARPRGLDVGADLWWLSPPCQPYTVKGRGGDLDDPRAASLVRVMELIRTLRPPAVALENVPGFAGSRAHALVRETLGAVGYHVAEGCLCPTALGVPNRRERFYLVASRVAEPDPVAAREPRVGRPLADYLDPDPDPDPDLVLDPELAHRYRHALHVVDPSDPEAVSACFGESYGRAVVRAGSYLRTPDGGLRRFSPAEVVRLLHFPPRFSFPPGLARRKRWSLAGNSLSVAAVRSVLASLYPGVEEGT